MDSEKNTESLFEEFVNTKKRRELLPWWIKIFCWLFMIFGGLAIFCFFLGFTNIKPSLAFYGFETNEPFSLYGLIVIGTATFKGITAFLLWFEKELAIEFAKIDALIGIFLCVLHMFVLPFFINELGISIRLELALLIPYLIKIVKIGKEWESIKS